MDLGQALAMMRTATQLQDYANRYKTRPNLDWADIASSAPEDNMYAPPVAQTIPQASIGQFLADQYGPPPGSDQAALPIEAAVAGYAPPRPMERASMPAFLADPTFRELYGEPTQAPPSMRFAAAGMPEPSAPTGVVATLPSFETPPEQPTTSMGFRMPPPPFPGMTMTDVPQAAGMYTEPGRSLAMAEGEGEGETTLPTNLVPVRPQQLRPVQVNVPGREPTPFDKIKVPEPPKAEQPKDWQVGNPFQVDLDLGEGKKIIGTVNEFTIPEEGTSPRPIRITLPSGQVRSIPPSNQAVYNQIIDQYKALVGKTSAPKNEMYTSQVKIQDAEGNDIWVPARVDQDLKQVVYVDPSNPELGEVQYGTRLADIQIGENYKGPVDEYGKENTSEIEDLFARNQRFLEPTIQDITQTATGYRGNLSPMQLRSSIIPRFVTGAGRDLMGDIEWSMSDPRTGETYSLEDAETEGLVPSGFQTKLQDVYDRVKKMAGSLAQGASEVQSTQAATFRQNVLDTIEKDLTTLRADLARVTASGTPEEIADINDKIAKKEDERLRVLSSSAAGISAPGGTTVIETAPSVTKYSLDPNTLEGRFMLMAGANPAPNPNQPQTVPVPTPRQIADFVVQEAMSDIRSNAINVDPLYQRAISVLSGRLRDIQDAAVEQFGEYAQDVLKQQAKFIYFDPASNEYKTRSMTLEQALNDFKRYADDYKNALKSGQTSAAQAKENFDAAAKVFSGAIQVKGLPTFGPQDSYSLLSYVGDMFTPVREIDTALTGQFAATPTSVTSEAPKTMVSGPPGSGRTTPPVRKVAALPLYFTPGGKGFGKDGYEKAGSSFNLFERMRSDDNTYNQTGIAYSSGSVESTIGDNIGRAAFNDAGKSTISTLTPAINQTVSGLNKEIISPAGAPLRRSFLNLVYDITNRVGFRIRFDETDIAKTFEDLYKFAAQKDASGNFVNSDAAVDGQIKNAFYKWKGAGAGKTVDQANLDNNYNLNGTSPGQSVLGINQSLISLGNPNNEYSGRIPGSTTALYDNIQSQWYELAQLYAAAGRGHTSYKNPSGEVVTWVFNPLSRVPGYDTSLYRSVLTMPAAKRGDTDKLIPYQDADGKKVNVGVGTEPVYSALIVQAKDIFATNYAPIFSAGTKYTGPFIAQAKAQYNSVKGTNGDIAKNTPYRPDEDQATEWDNVSKDSVDRLFIDSLILGNLFAKNRYRSTYTSGGWPAFRTSNAITQP